MTYFLMFALIVLGIFFFSSIILPLLPIFLLFSLVSMFFRKPTVRVYTRTFQMPEDGDPFFGAFNSSAASRSSKPEASHMIEHEPEQIEHTIIDADFTENDR